jgi:hypothetical protein
MRVRRGLLFWALFLIPLGGLPLLVRAGVIDPGPLAEAWRLWPLILIAAGIAVIVARSRTALVGTVLIALVLGTMGGAVLASGTGWFGSLTDCGRALAAGDPHIDRNGTFAGRAGVRLELRCGSLTVQPTAGTDWTLAVGHRGPPPAIESGSDRLVVRAPSQGGEGRQDWTVGLPATAVQSLAITTNAGATTVDLSGMTLREVDIDVNAGDLRLDASSATLERIDVGANAGRIRLLAGTTALAGELSINAGAIDLCVPADAALRLDVNEQLTFAHNLAQRGLAHEGTVWTRAGSGPLVALHIAGNAAGLTLDPEGGCR